MNLKFSDFVYMTEFSQDASRKQKLIGC